MKLKYYMRGVGTGIIFSLFVFLVIIIPNVRLEERMKGTSTAANASETGKLDGILGGDKEPDKNSSGQGTLPTGNDVTPVLTTSPSDEVTPTPTPESTATPTPTPEPTATPTPTPEPTATPTPTPEPTATPTPTPKPTATPTPTPKPTATPTPTPVPTATPTPTLVPTLSPTGTPTPIVEINEETGEVKFTITKGMTSEKLSSNLEKLGIVDDWKELNTYIIRHGYAFKIQIGTFTFKPGMSYDEITRIVTGRKK